MLRTVARNAARQLAPRCEAVVASRSMSMAGLKGYDDKEAAEEMLYFKKEDERLLRDLLKKVRKSAEKHDVHAAQGMLAAEKSALMEIVGNYNLDEKTVAALLEWKHQSY